MGNKASLKRQDLEELVEQSNLSHEQVKELYAKFQKIAGTNRKDGVIDKKEFCLALGRTESPFMNRLFDLFDVDGSGTIDFREFLTGLNNATKGTQEDKIRFSFRIYDVNGDGFISKEELMQIFESSKIDDDVDHETTVTELLASADSDGDNQISYDEFKVLIQKHPSMIQDVTEEKKTRRTRHRGMSNLLHLPALGSNIKIILLGTGESGKTTLFRQLEFLETGSYDEEHGVKYERLVKNNILHACITLIRAADDLGFSIKNQEIIDFANQRPHDRVFDAEMAEKVKQIWNDPDVKLVREHADEIMLQETVPYYINKIDKIASEEYDPSHEDVFRIKLKTTGVAEKVFKINGRQLVICDTGGQKVERKKWSTRYPGTTTVVYFVGLSDYTRKMYEDGETNRFLDSLEQFEQVVNDPQLVNIPFVLVLSKVDLLQDALNRKPLSTLFPEYTGGNDMKQAIAFIQEKFQQRYKGTEQRKIVPVVTTLIDPMLISNTLKIVLDVTTTPNKSI